MAHFCQNSPNSYTQSNLPGYLYANNFNLVVTTERIFKIWYSSESYCSAESELSSSGHLLLLINFLCKAQTFLLLYTPLVLRCCVLQELLQPPSSVNRIWSNEQILTFKVSKQLYQTSWHDRIIGKGVPMHPWWAKWNWQINWQCLMDGQTNIQMNGQMYG